jgi:hypothetical protein
VIQYLDLLSLSTQECEMITTRLSPEEEAVVAAPLRRKAFIAGDQKSYFEQAKERQLADLMKNAASGFDRSSGQMIGPYFVPNYAGVIGGGLADIGKNIAGYYADRADAKNFQDWAAAAPQSAPQTDITGLPAPGENVPMVAPTREQKMSHLLQGMNLPGIGDEAKKAYFDLLTDGEDATKKQNKLVNLSTGFSFDPNTDELTALPEVQAAIKEQNATKQGAREDYRTAGWNHAEEVRNKRTDEILELYESKKQLDQEYRDPVMEELAQARKDKITADINRARRLEDEGTPLTAQQTKVGNGMLDVLRDLDYLQGTFKPEYSGSPIKTQERNIGNRLGGLAPKPIREMTNWHRDYEKLSNIKERLATFGMSLSKLELQAWKDATINETMAPEDIAKNFKLRKDLLVEKINGQRSQLKLGRANFRQLDAYAEKLGVSHFLAPMEDRKEAALKSEQRSAPSRLPKRPRNFGKDPSQNAYEQAGELMGGLIKTESNGDSNAVSPAGAVGLTQIMPTTAARAGFGMTPFDLETASDEDKIEFSQRYLAHLIDKYKGNVNMALAAYNAGPNRVDTTAPKNLPAETKAYAPKVLKNALKNSNPVGSANAAESELEALRKELGQ